MSEKKEKKFHKYLYLEKHNQEGKIVLSGGVKIYLKHLFGTEECCVLKAIETKKGLMDVANLESSILVDSFIKKQIKYLFGEDLPEGIFLKVQIALWGKAALNISKLHLSEDDLYMFFVTNGKLDKFDRRDGSVGYQIMLHSFDFCPVRRKNQEEQSQEQAQPQTEYSQSEYSQDDFTPLPEDFGDDEDDLPF